MNPSETTELVLRTSDLVVIGAAIVSLIGALAAGIIFRQARPNVNKGTSRTLTYILAPDFVTPCWISIIVYRRFYCG